MTRGRRPAEHVRRPPSGGPPLPIDPDLDPDDPGEPTASHHPGPHVHRAHPGVLAAIALGGCVGAVGRYAVEQAWPTPSGHFPLTTFVVNTSGALLLGLLLTVILERPRAVESVTRRIGLRARRPVGPPGRWLRAFACVGVLGSWTTMSTLAVEADTLVKHGSPATAAAYLVASAAAGVLAAALGTSLGRRLAPPPAPTGHPSP